MRASRWLGLLVALLVVGGLAIPLAAPASACDINDLDFGTSGASLAGCAGDLWLDVTGLDVYAPPTVDDVIYSVYDAYTPDDPPCNSYACLDAGD